MALLQLEVQNGDARAGRLFTPHGEVETPAFMPVGTQGAVKALTPELIRETGTHMILANTYHLHLRPGSGIIAELGGLHRFMNWPGPILTDSGGFQIYSLARLCRLDDEGVVFQSHIDGSTHRLTPERAMEIQAQLGADIVMALDECTPYPCEYSAAAAAVERTTRWAARCRAAQRRPDQALFGIVQGSVYPQLREQSAKALVAMDFPGYALGGLSVGEGRERMCAMLEATVPLLPSDRPRYLMGVGTPADFILAVERGIDLFDCVVPTRTARNATLYTSRGRLNLRNAQYVRDAGPLDPDCACPTCRQYSRAYLRHLYVAKEILASILGTLHNVAFFQNIMARIRSAIRTGTWAQLKEEVLAVYGACDEHASAGWDL
ncbi:tRNA guanosine(34) transglycosylase Tgt [bacterium]|nr:tRNA guanosine(34) transglycosylase Tgt [bacterium]